MSGVSALLVLEDRVILGTHHGVLSIYKRSQSFGNESIAWPQVASMTLMETVVVDGLKVVDDESFIACCAGNLTMHCIALLSIVHVDIPIALSSRKSSAKMASNRTSSLSVEDVDVGREHIVCSHCTGAFCLQTREVLTSPRRSMRVASLDRSQASQSQRVCVAQHGNLALLQVTSCDSAFLVSSSQRVLGCDPIAHTSS